ncbi:hypothetical protein ACIBK9_13625 [Nonomuraea sp. NPDC050227]|uniref:hypothetical protein n=1 Tax=Nonomuraea sp. NPDC050227 TaxID=3364360 RepID=UPI0037B073E8
MLDNSLLNGDIRGGKPCSCRRGLGLSAFAAAAVTLPAAAAMAASSALTWRVAGAFGRHTVSAGLALSACAMLASGLAGLFALRAGLPVLPAVCATCQVAAAGLVVSPLQASVLQHAPAEVLRARSPASSGGSPRRREGCASPATGRDGPSSRAGRR